MPYEQTTEAPSTLSQNEVREMQADVALLSVGVAYNVDGARELLQEIIQQRTQAYKHKSESKEKQRKADLLAIENAALAANPTDVQVANAKQRLYGI